LKTLKIQISKLGHVFKQYQARAKKLDAAYGQDKNRLCKDNFLKQQRGIVTKCEFLA
jgi:hypothetical protein